LQGYFAHSPASSNFLPNHNHPALHPNRVPLPTKAVGDTAEFKQSAITGLCMEQAITYPKSSGNSSVAHTHTVAHLSRLPNLDTASPEVVAQAVHNLLLETEKNPTPQKCEAFLTAYVCVTDQHGPAIMPVLLDVLLDWLAQPHANNADLNQMISELEAECGQYFVEEVSVDASDDKRKAASQALREVMEQSHSTRLLSMLEIALSSVSQEPVATQDLLFNTLNDMLPNLHGSKLKTLRLNVNQLWTKLKTDNPEFNTRLKALCKEITIASRAMEQPLLKAHAAMVNFVPAPDRSAALRSKSEVPRTPTECAIHCISSIRLACLDPLTTPEQKRILATLEKQFIDAWLRHDLTIPYASHLFSEMEAVCRQNGLPALADLAIRSKLSLPLVQPLAHWRDMLSRAANAGHDAGTAKTVETLNSSYRDIRKSVDAAWTTFEADVAGIVTRCHSSQSPKADELIRLLSRDGGELTPLPVWMRVQQYVTAMNGQLPQQDEPTRQLLGQLNEMLPALMQKSQALGNEIKDFFAKSAMICQSAQLTALGDLATRLQTQCASGDFRSMSARLNDNVYQRVFETMLVHCLLTATISKEEAASAREFARAWKETLAEISKNHGEDVVLRGIAKAIADIKDPPRSWLWRVPAFVQIARASRPEHQKQALLNFLNSEKKTGFDLAALSLCAYLANTVALAPHLPGKKAGDKINDTLVTPNVARIKNKQSEHTNVRGITLHYHAPAIKEQGVGARSITDTRNDIANPSAVLSAALAHGIPSGGVSGSTNLKLFQVKNMKERHYNIDFKYALMDSIRQFNSGHSIHDALWTAQRLVDEGHIDWELDLRRHTKEEIALDPDKAHVMDYQKFFQLYKGTETGDLLEEAVQYAMDRTVEYFRQHSDFHDS
jgi:hypothetical protein